MRIQLLIDNEVVAEIELEEGSQLIGSAKPSNILIDDPSVSPTHARIFQQDGISFIADIGSERGTLVTGQRVDVPTGLKDGDSVQLGDFVFQVKLLGSPPHLGDQVAAGTLNVPGSRPKPPPLPRGRPKPPPLPQRDQENSGRVPRPFWKKSVTRASIAVLCISVLTWAFWSHSEKSNADRHGSLSNTETEVDVQTLDNSPEAIHKKFRSALNLPEANDKPEASVWIPASKHVSATKFYLDGYNDGQRQRQIEQKHAIMKEKGWIPSSKVNPDKLTAKDIKSSSEYSIKEAGRHDGAAGQRIADRSSLGLVLSTEDCIEQINAALKDMGPNAIPKDLVELGGLLGILLRHDPALTNVLAETSAPDDAEFTSSSEKRRRITERRQTLVGAATDALRESCKELGITCLIRADKKYFAHPERTQDSSRRWGKSDWDDTEFDDRIPTEDVALVSNDSAIVFHTPLSYSTWEPGNPLNEGNSSYGYVNQLATSTNGALFLVSGDIDRLPSDLMPLDPTIRPRYQRHAHLGINRENSKVSGPFAKFGQSLPPDPLDSDRDTGNFWQSSINVLMQFKLSGTSSGIAWVPGVNKEVAQKIKANPPPMNYKANLAPRIVMQLGFLDNASDWGTENDSDYSTPQKLIISSYFCFDFTEEVQIGTNTLKFPWLDKNPPGRDILL